MFIVKSLTIKYEIKAFYSGINCNIKNISNEDYYRFKENKLNQYSS